MKNFKKIQESLRSGNKMHCFRSGGGLRVVRIENKQGKLVMYGEGENLLRAFENTEDGKDCPYITGEHYQQQEGFLGIDCIAVNGYSIDIERFDNKFLAAITYTPQGVPKWLWRFCEKNKFTVEFNGLIAKPSEIITGGTSVSGVDYSNSNEKTIKVHLQLISDLFLIDWTEFVKEELSNEI